MAFMELIKQVRLLLQRNLAIHVRQPVILILELLWPVMIFLVVMAARNAIPPVAQPTCHYKAWALPSAGIVPFFQSMICNIDDCQNETEYEDIPSYPGSSVLKLVENTMPLITDRNITDLVSALPKGMRLVRVAIDALSGPDLSALLGKGFPIRNLLRDSNETRQLLLQQKLTADDVNHLFNSSLQLPQILEIMHENNFCDFTQDAETTNSPTFAKLRTSLCGATEEERKDFFRQLKNQLNVKSIVQTMGLAMSELGRLDISDILKNIGGLLNSVQSSDILSTDIVTLMSTILGQIRFENVDTEIISLLVDDLEPLYRQSQWAGLIRILKDIKFPKSTKRLDKDQDLSFSELILGSNKENKTDKFENENKIAETLNNSSSILETVLDLAGTGFDVVQLLPQKNSTQLQDALKYFIILVEVADGELVSHELLNVVESAKKNIEFTRSLKKDDSSRFVDNTADVLGAIFLNVAGTPQKNQGRSKKINWCDKRETKRLLQFSDKKNIESLQEYACKISKLLQQDPSGVEDKEKWKKSSDKIRKMLNSENLMKIKNNVLMWDKDELTDAKDTSRFGDMVHNMETGNNVEDFIVAAECSVHGFREILETQSNSTIETSSDSSSHVNTDKEKLLLSYLFGAKHAINDLKNQLIRVSGKLTEKDARNILDSLNYMMMNMTNPPSSAMVLIRFIPRLIDLVQKFNESNIDLNEVPEFVSALVEDLEPVIWKSISSEEVMKFSLKNESKNFCIVPETLDPAKSFFTQLSCSENQNKLPFKISMPNRNRMKQINTSLISHTIQNTTKFDTQSFSRMLLQLTSGSGFVVKVLLQFIKPIDGCESACSDPDLMLKKMCFLGRLQNIKSILGEDEVAEANGISSNSTNILMQLQPILGLGEDILGAYQHFMDTVESSAANNYTDSKDIVRLIVSGVRLLESFDTSEHKMRPALHVTLSMISLLRNRVADAALYNSTSIVQIQNVFPGSPLTQDVVKSLLPVLPEITSTLFWTALAPGEFLHLVLESGRNMSVVMSQLCNSSLTTYLYNPGLDKSIVENLGSIICRHKFYDVFEEIFQDPDIQEIVFEADNTDEIAWDEMTENIQDIVSLLTHLADVRKADLAVIPPLPKWQMMALDIYSHIKNPEVILYIINNKLFSDFCYKSSNDSSQTFVSNNSRKALFTELCSMSTQSFASTLVKNLNQTVLESIKDSGMGPNAIGMAVLKEKFWEALLNVPEIKNLAKMVFDVDVLNTTKTEDSETIDVAKGRKRFSKTFVEKLMNATQRAYDLADDATDKKLSNVLLGSLVPELMQDMAVFVEESDGIINLNNLVDRGNGFEILFRNILHQNMERRRLESYIRTLSSFFSKKKNANKLDQLCHELKYKNHIRTSDLTLTRLCTLNPKSWTVDSIVQQGNFNGAWIKIDELLDESTKNKTRGLYLEKRKAGFLNSLNRTLLSGVHVPDWTSLKKSSFYFSALRTFVRNLDNIKSDSKNSSMYNHICVTKNAEVAFQESVHKLLDAIPDAEFMTCGLLNKSISSFYSWVSKSADVKSTIEKVSKELAGNKSCAQTWHWLLKFIDDAEVLYNKLSGTLPQEASGRVSVCLTNFTKSPLMRSLKGHANVLKQALKLLTGLATPASQWKEMREQISKRISQHLPVFLKISDVMSNQTSWFLDYSSTDMHILKESSINFNWLVRHGFSAASLMKRICELDSHDTLKSVFVFPLRASMVTRSRTKDFLCRNDTLQELIDTLNQEDIKSKVLEMQEKEFFSGKWLQNLMSSFDALLKIIEHVGDSLKDLQFHNIYNVFQMFTKPQVLQNLAESMESLMSVLDPIFTGSSLMDTLRQVMDGLKAFRSLTKLANFTFVYKIKDLFGESARSVLLKELRMDPAVASQILESEIDLKQAIVSKEDGRVSFCHGKKDPSIVCTLSTNIRTAVTSEYLQDLVLQRFLYSFGTLGIEGVLREAHVDAYEAEKTLEVLSSAPSVVSRLTNHLETVTSVMHPELKELFDNLDHGAAWLATPEALSIGGQIMCGKPLTALSKKFSLLAPEDTENKIEEKELLRLPTDFCRYGYKEIMKMRGGAILWGFLKPLFRGKILYAPKAYAPGQNIISKVNETLKILEEQIKFVKAAAEGSTGLHYVQRKSETLLSLQKFLASKSVTKFLGSPTWGFALSWLETSNTSTRSLLTLIELVGNVTECISLDRFIGFDTESELEEAAATLHDRREFIAAIVFMEEEKSNSKLKKRWTNNYSKLPENVRYKLRMDIDNVPTTEYIKYRWWRPYPYDDFFEDLRYFRGFIQLQDTVDTAIMSLQSRSTQLPSAKKYLQQFPYPCHQRDKFGTLLKGSMPAVMTISWVFIVAFLVREKVLDRELELDETLRVMGLKQSAGWLAWFLTGLCVLLVSVIGIVLVLKWGGITPLTDLTILFLFVADFAILLIAYCQLMSTFFSRATTAALMSVLIYVLSFFPFLLFVTWELDFLYWQKLLSCILVSTSFCFGCLYLNRYEDMGQGVQWSNMWHSPVVEDRMNFGTTLVSMALCSFVYFIMSWYITRIWTGNRERKPCGWYFLMMTPFFSETVDENCDDYKMKSVSRDNRMDTTVPSKVVGISMKSVHAVYSKRGSKEWKALCGLNLDFYEDHITALLGHNGAGKTTTLKILTGRLDPTQGCVTVNGFKYPERISEARKHIGFCPQNNTLYDKLTVKEHLKLFASLKGLLTPEEAEEDVNKMLESLNLVEKQNEPSDTLSGGQRRRLCVGIAFVGGSKVVILDEPTSSVDPVARRGIWDLILSYKKGRTILLTTHHLDEADILSDKVAILHKGRVLCCGSPLYLKCRFGSGYRLSLFPGTDKSEDRDSGHDSTSIKSEELPTVDCDGVMDFIQTYVPDATLLENDDSHLVISLPTEPLSSKPLSTFFAHLERSLHLWGFQSCSLSSATLDEVFLTLCRLEDAKVAHHCGADKFSEITRASFKKCHETTNSITAESHKERMNALAVEIHKKDSLPPQRTSFLGIRLKCSQLKSLIKKRYWHTRRNWKALTSSIIMPCIFIALAMGLAVGRPQKSPDPSIELTPELYSTAEQKTVSFFAWKGRPAIGINLLDTLKANVTHGSQCWHDLSKCRTHVDNEVPYPFKSNVASRCLCEEECSTSPLPILPFLNSNNQVIYNLSSVDIPNYLLNSYLLFNEKRYGGWSVDGNGYGEPNVKVWFENSGYHSAPSYLNTLNNAILKNMTNQDYSIQTWSHPLRLSVEQLGRETLLQRLGEVGIAFVFLIGLSLVPSTFAIYVVGERESEQKRLQMVTGHLGPLMYWSAALLWDLTIVLTTSVLSAAIVAAFALPAFYDRENFRAVYSLVFFYGWATTPLTYLSSRFFHEGSLAFMVIFTSHLFVGLVIMLSLVSLRMISISKDVAVTLDLVQRISLAFPQYSLVGGLTDLNENQIRSEIFAQFGQDVYASPFGWNSLGPNYVALFLQGIVFFLLTVIIEMIPFKHWMQKFLLGSKPLQESVEEETENCLLKVQNVSQVYSSKAGNKYALNDLSLTIPEGECFGLVGANGAGKTTLFRLLIGEDKPVTGRILRIGLQSKAIPKHRFVGYCPQKDALDGLLTPRQHLEVYAGLRGVPSSQINRVVERSLQSLELNTHADFSVSSLSGGTKRKLCTAIANLGDPELILLDEPTSGMDPGTRRLVWRCISRATEAGRSVILTSHSIEDCDVLCTRLGIVVNGRIACLDSPVKLKTRLGSGYTMSFRIPEGEQDWPSLLNFIHKVMPFAQLQVRSGRRIEMSLPDETITLSNLFCHLEECAQQFGIEDLAIDPTTLDQVFVNFVRQQSDATENLHNDSALSTHLVNESMDCTKL